MRREILLWGLVVSVSLGGLGCGRGAPAQPIAFSHKTHGGDNQIPCLYCHTADRSPSAGVPAVQTCMGCHQIVARQLPEVQTLAGYWDRKEPIPWVRVHNLPDHVQFTHEPHTRAGVACETCHGQVQTMSQIRQVSSLQMGWCLSCHEQKQAPTDCAACHY